MPVRLHLPSRHFPANRPSSAGDLTDIGTPPTGHTTLTPSPGSSPMGSPVVQSGDLPEMKMAMGLDQDENGDEEGQGMRVEGVEGSGGREGGSSMGELAILLQTVDFAAQKHSLQRRKDVDQTPYINHPIAVANFLASTGITDMDVLQAAVLHDTVEDTHTTIEEITRKFGARVASIVKQCTDDPSLSGQQRKAEQVRSVPFKSRQAQQVKLADKLHNLESIRRSPPVGWGVKRVQAYFVWAKQVTDVCAPAHPALAARLQRLYETAYTKVNGSYYPCHPEVCGPLTEAEKTRIDSRFADLKAGEIPAPKPIFF